VPLERLAQPREKGKPSQGSRAVVGFIIDGADPGVCRLVNPPASTPAHPSWTCVRTPLHCVRPQAAAGA
jgi:hypothetical protein